MNNLILAFAITVLALPSLVAQPSPSQESARAMTSTHQDLVALFKEWREFQKPRLVDRVPDYAEAAMAEQRAAGMMPVALIASELR